MQREPQSSFYQTVNFLALQLAREHGIPASPPLTHQQTRKAEAEMVRNQLTLAEYLEACAQLWRTIKRKQNVYPKPYILISPSVIQLALSNQTDRKTKIVQRHEALHKTLNDWVSRYQHSHPKTSLQETILWLEWDGVHQQFPAHQYSSWKTEKLSRQ